MFQIEIWPHEFYYVAGLLIMAGIGLFLVTSAVGRAWCGYACPQTVWTDLFKHVDRLVDGDRNAQIRLANGAWPDRKSTQLNSSHLCASRMPSSARKETITKPTRAGDDDGQLPIPIVRAEAI